MFIAILLLSSCKTPRLHLSVTDSSVVHTDTIGVKIINTDTIRFKKSRTITKVLHPRPYRRNEYNFLQVVVIAALFIVSYFIKK